MGDARVFREFLADVPAFRFHLTHVERLDEALKRIAETPFDVVLLDLSLPDSQGLDTFMCLHAQSEGLPILVLSGYTDESLAITAVQEGAQDYLVKGQVDGHAMVRAMQYAIERKQGEVERTRLIQELQEALKAREEMIANVSHELRTPLTHIMGYADLLTISGMEGKMDAEQMQTVTFIREQAEALTRLVNRLLSLQTLMHEGLTWDEIDLEELALTLAMMWQERASSLGIALRMTVPKELPRIHGDFQRLQEALDQILDNACKFTEEGGTVCFKLEHHDSTIHFTISDTGPGIPTNKLEQVFDRFFQVNGSKTRHHGGMGIGLTLVRQIVSLHNGRVWVESEGVAGQGTTVHITLPLTR